MKKSTACIGVLVLNFMYPFIVSFYLQGYRIFVICIHHLYIFSVSELDRAAKMLAKIIIATFAERVGHVKKKKKKKKKKKIVAKCTAAHFISVMKRMSSFRGNRLKTITRGYKFFIKSDNLCSPGRGMVCRRLRSNVGRFSDPIADPRGTNESFSILPEQRQRKRRGRETRR